MSTRLDMSKLSLMDALDLAKLIEMEAHHRYNMFASRLGRSGGYDAGAAESFYRTAHTLKGTAASFEADELVEPATALAEVGLRWFEGGSLDPLDVDAASRNLERLVEAVQLYMERVEGDAVG